MVFGWYPSFQLELSEISIFFLAHISKFQSHLLTHLQQFIYLVAIDNLSNEIFSPCTLFLSGFNVIMKVDYATKITCDIDKIHSSKIEK